MSDTTHLTDAVRDNFRVTTDTDYAHVRYSEADAGTGTRCVVVATRLPPGHNMAGPVLVTVLHPWTAAKVMQDHGYLDESYVAEHLCPPTDVRPGASLPYGPEDLTALTMLVRHALGRTNT